jgi:hypothetical protein
LDEITKSNAVEWKSFIEQKGLAKKEHKIFEEWDRYSEGPRHTQSPTMYDDDGDDDDDDDKIEGRKKGHIGG